MVTPNLKFSVYVTLSNPANLLYVSAIRPALLQKTWEVRYQITDDIGSNAGSRSDNVSQRNNIEILIER